MSEQEQGQNLNDQLEQRLQKLQALKESDINPYGGRLDGISHAAAAKADFEKDEDGEKTVILAGRLTAKRVMGKTIFADVQDQSDRCQLFVQKNKLGAEQFDVFKHLDIGDIVSATGTMFRTKMGEVTLRVQEFRILSKSLRPLPEKFHGLQDVQQRYRQRYLDLISNQESKDVFLKRIRVISRIRRFLEEREYLEVETPMLQSIPGGANARPFETYYNALNCKMYMRIATELYLKKLLVGGFERVFEINRNFRNEGIDRRHNPEFTCMEIYQAYGDCRSMMDLAEELITTLAEDVMGGLKLKRYDGEEINLERPWRRASFHELIEERMGSEWNGLSIEEKRVKASELKLHVTDEMSAMDIDVEIYEKVIEPTLIQPIFVTRLPKHLVPLAKTCPDNSELVDVFELAINGQEIAPGYSELNDPEEQRKRFLEQLESGDSELGEELAGKIDEDFLTAMEHGMPPAGGMGIGIDRLIMLLTGAPSIRDVILFPQLRPVGQE